MVVALGMALSTFTAIPAQAAATTVSIAAVSGETIAYGETLKATHDGDAGATVTWQRVDGSNVTDITTGDTYIVTEEDMGYSIQAKVDDAVSSAAAIASYVKTFNTNSTYASNRLSDENAIFKVKGNDRTFVLAKTFNNNESTYYVVANETYGKRKLNESTYTIDGLVAKGRWNPSVVSETNLAYWLNVGFANYGNSDYGDGNKLPTELIDWINWDHIWRTEGTTSLPEQTVSGYYTDNLDSYTFTAGITVPSMSEITNYSKVGYLALPANSEHNSANGYTIQTRTVCDRQDKSAYAWNLVVGTQTAAEGATSFVATDTRFRSNHHIYPTTNMIRPQFYLKDGFFGSVAVDLASAGSDVIAEIKKEDVEDLVLIYSADDMREYLGIDVSLYPEITAVSGEAIAYGETVRATAPNVTAFIWKADDVVVASGTDEYIVKECDAGKKLTAEYTAADGTVYKSGEDVPALLNEAWKPNDTVASIKNSPNTFTVDGQSFTLIADFNNDESTYFVAANDMYGSVNISTVTLSPAEGIISWLNDAEGLAGGYGSKELPEGILKNIDTDHEWLAEPAPLDATASDSAEAYTFTAGIALPSISEFRRYPDTFNWYVKNPDKTEVIDSSTGALTTADNYGYWTRTRADFANANKDHLLVADVATNATYANFNPPHWDLPATTNVRPVFYLAEDFFRNVTIDLYESEAVTNILAERYSLEEMKALYLPTGEYVEEDLIRLGFKAEKAISVSFTDENGTELDVLEGATSLKAAITAESFNKSFEAVAILSVYDGNGNLVAVDMANIDTTSTGTDSVSITLTELENIDAGHVAKVMFWDSMDGMVPVGDIADFGTEITPAGELSFAAGAASDGSIGGYNFF